MNSKSAFFTPHVCKTAQKGEVSKIGHSVKIGLVGNLVPKKTSSYGISRKKFNLLAFSSKKADV